MAEILGYVGWTGKIGLFIYLVVILMESFMQVLHTASLSSYLFIAALFITLFLCK